MKKRLLSIILVVTLILGSFSAMTVNSDAASSIKLSKTSATFYLGDTYKLTLKNAKANKVIWSSADKKIATVKNGLVTSKKTGFTKITAKYKNKTYTCKIKIKDSYIVDASTNMETGRDFSYSFSIFNPTNHVITLDSVTVVDILDGRVLGSFTSDRTMMGGWGLGKLLNPLKKGEGGDWIDHHPYTKEFNEREFYFNFRDKKGNAFHFVYRYKIIEVSPQEPELGEKDLPSTFHDADYKIKVSNDVYWVPAAALGKSDYTNEEIKAMLKLSPEEKQKKIDTLYEALQLYYFSKFYASNDNISFYNDFCQWEYHKPGYDAVRTNNGCCATSLSWLSYLLKDDYDELGLIQLSEVDGGHVINYIEKDGWYYIIDMTTHKYSDAYTLNNTESGNISDYNASYIGGNIHATKSLENFMAYYGPRAFRKLGQALYAPLLEAPAIGCKHTDSETHLYFEPETYSLYKTIYKDSAVPVIYDVLESPFQAPNWGSLPSYSFK